MYKRPSYLLFFLLCVAFAEASYPQNSSGKQRTDSKSEVLMAQLSYAKEDSDKVDMLNNLTVNLERVKNFKKAIEYGNSALELSKKLHLQEREFKASLNLGSVYNHLNNYPTALKYTTQALNDANSLPDKKYTGASYVQLADIYAHQGNQAKSEEYRAEAAKFSKEINFLDGYSFQSGEKSKLEEFRKVLEDIGSSAKNSRQSKNAQTEKKRHEDAETDESYKHFIMMLDQYIKSTEADSAKAEEKKKQEKLLAAKKKRNFQLLIGSGVFLITILFAAILLWQRKQKKLALEKAEGIYKMAELEMQSLRTQLNPHFMFNSLNAIQELILLEQNEKSHTYLARFGKLLRMLLENAEHPFISLRKEIEFLHLYLGLENLRIPDLQYSIFTDPVINIDEVLLPNMILQPYIENAIWHGLSHKDNNKQLQIRIFNVSGVMNYEIEDNGIGRNKALERKSLFRQKHHSKGMKLLNKRFQLLNEQYNSKICITISDVIKVNEVAGTLVKIEIPDTLSQHVIQHT